MSQYDPTKDHILHQAELNGLQMTIHQYEGEEPKIKIGPRIIRGKGTPLYLRVGRLTIQEWKWISDEISSCLKT